MAKVLGRIATLAIILTSVVTVDAASAQTPGSALYLRQPASVVAPVSAKTVAFANRGTAPVHLASCCDQGGCDAGCAAPTCGAPACSTCDSGCAAPGCDSCSLGCDSCGVGCGNSCGCDSGLSGLLGSLEGIIKPSDNCFNCFLSPMTNPTFFEDPRTLTEARLIYLHHKVPLTAGGGDVNLVAVQLRAALSERLSIIATKDGYLTSTNPLIDDGFADINVGLKYNLIRDPRRQLVYSVGATYELPVGSTRSLQGNGDGTFHLFGTGGTRIAGWNALLAHGVIIPVDGAAESEWGYISGHLSHRIADTNLFFLSEINAYHYWDSGNGGLDGVEGGDLINLGSRNVEDNDIVTGAFGVKYKPHNGLEVGVAWENPLTKRRDVLDNRLTVDVIVRY